MCKKLTHLGMGPRRRGSPQSFGLFRGSILGAGFRPTTGRVKQLTREQVQARKEKAARFTETVLGDPDRADEIGPMPR